MQPIPDSFGICSIIITYTLTFETDSGEIVEQSISNESCVGGFCCASLPSNLKDVCSVNITASNGLHESSTMLDISMCNLLMNFGLGGNGYSVADPCRGPVSYPFIWHFIEG